MRMEDPFYTISNAIFKEAILDSQLETKKTHVNRD